MSLYTVRRKSMSLCLLYKFPYGLVSTDGMPSLTPVQWNSKHQNSHGYEVPHSRTNNHKFSFFPHTIREWNILPEDTVKLPTLESFNKTLGKIIWLLVTDPSAFFIYKHPQESSHEEGGASRKMKKSDPQIFNLRTEQHYTADQQNKPVLPIFQISLRFCCIEPIDTVIF